MKVNSRMALCASILIAAAPAASAQQVQSHFTPALGGVPGPVIVKVDGSRVTDVAGQPLGRIENIVLSQVGCAEAAILTLANGRLVPIPWTLVRVSDTRAAGMMPGANLVFTVNADHARIAQAPSFTRSQWPDMNNQNWLQASFNFFGTANAFAVGGAGAATNTVTGGATNRSDFGTTATGGAQQDRIGTTSTTTTNTTTLLPPTGRPNPGTPDAIRPNNPSPTPGIPPGPPDNPPRTPGIPPGTPDNRPPDTRPQDNTQNPGTPPPSRPPGTAPSPSPSTPPPNPSTQP